MNITFRASGYRRSLAVGALLAALSASSGAAVAQTSVAVTQPLRLSFVPHAAFYSLRTKQPALVDPEAFVTAPGAEPATVFQIAHAAGIRNAFMSDDGTLPALDANGRQLGVDLQRWFSATGLVAFSPPTDTGGGVSISARFADLVPNGRYSLFVLQLDSSLVTATPLDGTGAANSFSARADGSADVTMTAPRPLRSGQAVSLVFHSDGRDHGLQTGAPGIDAEQQLIVKP